MMNNEKTDQEICWNKNLIKTSKKPPSPDCKMAMPLALPGETSLAIAPRSADTSGCTDPK